jgi:hypothetical protein
MTLLLLPQPLDDRDTSAGYVFAHVTGTGTATDPWRPILDIFGNNWVATVPSNLDGTPKDSWFVAYVSPSVNAIDNGQMITEALPKVGLDQLLGLTASQRTALQNSILSKFGITINITVTTTLRQIIEGIGQAQLGPNFIADNNVASPTL